MATYIVDSAASNLSATTGADSVWVQSGGIGGSSIIGSGGNDTIQVDDATNASAAGIIIRGADGNDSIKIESGSFSAGGPSVYGGDGADSITLSGMGTVSLINGNEGNDRLSAIQGVTISAATFSTGSDTINISGTIAEIGMGNGHDEFSGTVVSVATSNTIKLGDGRDTITVASLNGNSAVTIQGDSSTNYGADSMDIGGLDITGLVVKGQGGSDTITISGADVSSLIQGNGGADSIEISDNLAAGVTIGGGAGNDTIHISGDFATTTTGLIVGGAGADSIFIEHAIVSGVDAALTSIMGGAGADTITISGGFDGVEIETGTYATLAYSAFSESTVDATDVFQIVSGNGSAEVAMSGAGVLLDVDIVGVNMHLSAVGTVTASNLADNTTSYASVDASGVVTFAGDLATTVNSSITAAAVAVDKTLTTKGLAAVFDSNGADYLFVQGGSSGTDDDLVIRINGVSANALDDNGSAIEINFSGVGS